MRPSLGKITHVRFFRKNLRTEMPVDRARNVVGESITGVRRRAKYILIDTEKHTLISHLGMSGSWRFDNTDNEIKKHDHFFFVFHNGMKLIFNDPRRFGFFEIVDRYCENSSSWLTHLGIEPLSKDFISSFVFEKSRKRSINVKAFIMDQKIIVGVGNIYASEALFLAKIKPHKLVHRLKIEDCDRLVRSIQKVLQQAIGSGGSTIRSYVNSSGEEGQYQQRLLVYERKNEPCRSCQSPIRQTVMSGRSTYWCPKCQK